MSRPKRPFFEKAYYKFMYGGRHMTREVIERSVQRMIFIGGLTFVASKTGDFIIWSVLAIYLYATFREIFMDIFYRFQDARLREPKPFVFFKTLVCTLSVIGLAFYVGLSISSI